MKPTVQEAADNGNPSSPPAATEQFGRYECLLNAVASSAVALLRASDPEPVLADVLAAIGIASGASRAHLFKLETGTAGKHFAVEQERWAAAGGVATVGLPSSALAGDMEARGLTSWVTRLAAGEVIAVKAGTEPAPVEEFMFEQGILAVLILPVFVDDVWWGQIGLDDCDTARDWTRGEIDSLRILAELVGVSIAKHGRVKALASAQRIIEGSPAIIFRFSPELPCPLLYVSENVHRYGHTPEEYLRSPADWYRLIPFHSEDLVAIHGDMARIVEGTTKQARRECHAIRADGIVEWFDYSLTAVFDGKGRLSGIDGIALDVSERKVGEASQALLASIVDSSADAIAAATLGGTITSWNAAAERLFGYKAAEAIGQAVHIVVPPERRAEFDVTTADFASGTPAHHYDAEQMRKDGTRFPAAVTAFLIRDATGNPTGRSYISRDRSGQQRAEAALAYRDRLLHAVMVGTAALLTARSVGQGLDQALQSVGESLRVDRVIVMKHTLDKLSPPDLRGIWQAPDIAVHFDSFAGHVPPEDMGSMVTWRAPLLQGNAVIAQCASASGAVRALMEHLKIKSMVLVPISVDGVMWGNLGVDACKTTREWTANEIDALRTFADVTGSVLSGDETRLALEESEERFRVLSETAHDGIVTIDGAGLIRSWNRAAEHILGFNAQEAIGRPVHEVFVPGRSQSQTADGLADFVVSGVRSAVGRTIEAAALRRDGTEITLELSLAGALISGKWETLGIMRDVTKRNREAAAIKLSNTLLRTEMEASPDGILVVDASRKIILFNQRFSTMWNVPTKLLMGGNDSIVLERVASLIKDPKAFQAQVEYLYDHPSEAHLGEIEMSDGRTIRRNSMSLLTSEQEYLGRIWFFHDQTAEKQAAELALRMAHFDVLTGLVNRHVFVEAVQQAIAEERRNGARFAVLYLDLDHFKDVNDTLGHRVGDELLQAVGSRLRANTRKHDTVARFGGDEFAVVATNIADPAAAGILAVKIVSAMAVPFLIHGNEIFSTVSVGIHMSDANTEEPETLLSHADIALYRAKSAGRGAYRFFTDAMDSDVRKRVTLIADMRVALVEGQFFLVYQPQVTIETGQVIGLEALLRWNHPTRGLLFPDAFIAVAEQSGLIVKLGSWVLMTACKQTQEWRDAGIRPVRIGVNVSGTQFRMPLALEADIMGALKATGLPPQTLELELTESVLMYASKEHTEVLSRLRGFGITFAIDDFGTGYSSLAYLRRFPAHHIKIPQTFVRHLENDPGDAAVVKATIGLGLALGSKVIAEGVETSGQLELLKRWGCAEVQGFHFSRPLDVGQVTALLQGGGIIQPQTGLGS